MPHPLIHVVGVGLDGVAGLSEQSRKLIQSATLLIGSQRLLDSVRPLAMSVETWQLGDMVQVFQDLRLRVGDRPKTRTVILATGDPLFFGLGRLLLDTFPVRQLVFHPQLSAIQLAFSRLKVSWQDATLVSVHGRGEQRLSEALRRGDQKIAVLTDAVLTPVAIARLLQALDLPTIYQLWVCENLGGDDEQVFRYDPTRRINDELREDDFAQLNVVVLLRASAEWASNEWASERDGHNPSESVDKLPIIGLPDAVFKGYADRPTLMTKREMRLLILGAIAPLAHQTIWDIGAGTGSVSVELSRLCPTARIYAIEKSAMGAALIAENTKRLAIAPIEVVHAEAPAAFADLPLPERIFIGGSSGQLIAILSWLHRQLHSHRVASSTAIPAASPVRIVIALATLEHLAELTTWMTQEAIAQVWHTQLTQVNISRSLPVGPLTRFSPLNPVTLVTLTKKER